MKTTMLSDDCILRTAKGCAALNAVQPDCGPKCPFYKNKDMEIVSRNKAMERCVTYGYIFVDQLPSGWDK